MKNYLLKLGGILLFFSIFIITNGYGKGPAITNLFITDNNPVVRSMVDNYAEQVLVLKLNETRCKQISDANVSEFTLEIPSIGGSTLTLELFRNEIFNGGLETGIYSTAGKSAIEYKPGAYYKGKISGMNESIVSFSFFQNSVVGFISRSSGGNIVIASLNSADPAISNFYVMYDDSKLKIKKSFTCGLESMNLKNKIQNHIQQQMQNQGGSNCVRIYFECDYKMYTDNSSSIIDVNNYVTAAFNQMATIYSNESVSISISAIYTWTIPDPYVSNTSSGGYLNAFKTTRTSFNGDLAHLLSTSNLNMGGVAWLDVVCNSNYSYAFSNIYCSYNVFPTYSWDVMVMSHETGHNLESNHTQWCGWVGGALDNCYTTEGGCASGPAPVNGGTIMSYCHLTGYGINFSNGFGAQPGTVIRNRVNSATCLNSCFCIADVTISASPTSVICWGTNVTFTATPVNGGTTPVYHWKKNGNNVGTNSTSYSSAALINGDIITCEMVTSDGCAGASTELSNAVIMSVSSSVTPAISISTSSTTICQGDMANFTATYVNGGPLPAFQWKVNGGNVGTNSFFYNTTALNNGDQVTCVLTSSLSCASPTNTPSNQLNITTSVSVTPSIAISTPSTTICQGSPVTFTCSIVNGGTSPGYQWKVNGVNTTTGPTFTTSLLNNNDNVTCYMTSNNPCAVPGFANSNSVSMTVSGTGVIPTNGLLAWYPFNGNANDNSGNNFHGTSSGADLSDNRFSQNFDGYLFNGARDHIQIGSSAGLNNINTGLTVAAWVYLGANNSSQAAIVSKWKFLPTDDQYLLWLYNKKPNFATSNPGVIASGIQSNITLADSTWYFLVGTWDNSGLHKIYVNGSLSASATFPGFTWINNTSATDLRIGTEDSTYRAFKGKIDDVRIYNRSITPQEVQILWNEGISASVYIYTTNATACQGGSISFNAIATGAGLSPVYQWLVNGINAGTNSSSFNSTLLNNNDVVSCRVSSSDACAQLQQAISNAISVTVIPQINQSVTINVDNNPACIGDSVTFIASPSSGSLVSIYEWFINGSSVIGNDSDMLVTNGLSNNDIVVCNMTSLYPCVSPATAVSNNIQITLSSPTTPQVTIAPISMPVCQGDSIEFVPTPLNGGLSPTYEWYVNSNLIITGAGNFVLSNPVNLDQVNCIMTSNEYCITTNNVNSNTVSVVVNSAVVPLVTESNNQLWSTPASVYQWFYNSIPISPGGNGQSITPAATGYYHVEITDSDSCHAFSTNYTYILGIESISQAEGFNIFPNPTSGNSSISFTGNSYVKADFLSVDGKVLSNLFDGQVSNGQLVNIPTANMANGVYLVRIIRDQNVYSVPLIIAK